MVGQVDWSDKVPTFPNAANQFRYYYFMGWSVRQIGQKIVSTHPNTANQFSLRVLGTHKVKVNIENKKKKQISKRGKKSICKTGKLISDQFVIRKP